MTNKKTIKEFKNKHQGERCFVMATGPSINEMNLDLIQNEVRLGINTFYRHPMGCHYLFVADHVVWQRYKQDLLDSKTVPLFTTFHHPQSFYFDNSSGVKGTTVFLALKVACFMGFSEVYLLGCDFSDLEGYHHFDTTDSSPVSKMDPYGATTHPSGRRDYGNIYKGFESYRKLYEDDNRKLVNCTVGGNLNVLKREKLEDVINTKPMKNPSLFL
jgi:hypothetical protein